MKGPGPFLCHGLKTKALQMQGSSPDKKGICGGRCVGSFWGNVSNSVNSRASGVDLRFGLDFLWIKSFKGN